MNEKLGNTIAAIVGILVAAAFCSWGIYAIATYERPLDKYDYQVECLDKGWLWIDQRGTRVSCVDPNSENLIAILESADEAN